MDQIKQFDELLQEYIGPNKTIVDKNVTNLTAPGENYLSNILKIDVTLQNTENGNKEELNIVAKCVTDSMIGPTTELNENEIKFYKYIIPAIQKFQEKHNVPPADFFPKYIGGRLNLDGTDDKVDIDSVLLLENLNVAGYKMQDRHIGFDLDGAKLILKDLATLHATVIALKLLDRATFEKEIIANVHVFTPPDVGDGPPFHKGKDGPPHGNNDNGPPHDGKKDGPPFLDGPPPDISPVLLQAFKKDNRFSHIILKFETLKKKMDDMNRTFEFFKSPALEPFCTLIHADMWINNTMQIPNNGNLIKNKFVDFQVYKIGSPANDLIFFITSSVQANVLIEDFDSLIRFYHQCFSDTLKQFDCYDSKFSYDKFLDELKTNAIYAFYHCMFLIPRAVFAEKGKAFDDNHKEFKLEDVPPKAIEKLGILMLEAAKRGWY